MLIPRVRFTVRRLMLIVAALAVALALQTNYSRRIALRERLGQYHYHEYRRCLYSERIGRDLRRARICLEWALARERPPTDPGDNTGMSGGAFDAIHRWHVSIMSLHQFGYRGPSRPLVLSWFREAIWWIVEAVRDIVRSASQERLKRNTLLGAPQTVIWSETSWEPAFILLVGLALCVKAFWRARPACKVKCHWGSRYGD